MRTSPLVPDPTVLALEEIVTDADGITLVVRATRPEVCCPACAQVARRVHSRYARRLDDLPWQGLAVRLVLHTRRWFCDNPRCPRRVFTERLPAVAAPHSRRTARLATVVLVFGVAVGGRPGARLLGELGIAVSGDTLRRAINAVDLPAAPTPRVLGVDDWSLRKGHTYDAPHSLAKTDPEVAVGVPRAQLRERYGAATKRADRRRRQGCSYRTRWVIPQGALGRHLPGGAGRGSAADFAHFGRQRRPLWAGRPSRTAAIASLATDTRFRISQ